MDALPQRVLPCTPIIPQSAINIRFKEFLLASAILICCGWVTPSRAEIPQPPAAGEFFHDLAGIVDDNASQAIRQLQTDVYEGHGVPIVVVTIRSMGDYVPVTSIEAFATEWFNTWGIGSEQKNDGMLVLVSANDRKARIELGKDWGRRFDAFCERLMQRKMVPEFKNGDYGAGLLAAVSSLAEIAAAGASADPPEASLVDRVLDHPLIEFNRENNPISQNFGGQRIILLMVVAGLACVVAAIWMPAYRKPLLILGIGLILFAVFFWIVLLAVVIIGKIFGSGDSDRGGGGFGGGGFGGGSSGGGGASGGW